MKNQSITRGLATLLFVLSFFSCILAQNVRVEGYAFEEGNRGYLNEVNITILDAASKALVGSTASDMDGKFELDLPANKEYILQASKQIFKFKEMMVSTKNATGPIFVKVEMEREPGYVFELTLAEKREEEDQQVMSITDTRIEVYNHTTEKQELDLNTHPDPTFNYQLEQGNHYTILIRKDGYFNRRIEAYVNVKGCILCVDGVSDLGPGVSDNLTQGFEMGTLLANLEMDRASLNKTMKIENIYYDLDKAFIRPDAAVELDKVVVFMRENPSLLIELGSHTDARGTDTYNQELSQRRAESAVKYIIEKGIDIGRISARGYGESVLTNRCKNGVNCSEEEHQENRRTELKIVGFKDDPFANLTLADIIAKEKQTEILQEVQKEEGIQFSSEDELPEEIKRDLEKQKKREQERQERLLKRALKKEGKSGSTKDTGSTSGLDITAAGLDMVAGDFSDYKVEVLRSTTILESDHPIFSKFSNIQVDQPTPNEVAYLVGSFTSINDAAGYLNNVVKSDFPNAKLVEFKKGKRR